MIKDNILYGPPMPITTPEESTGWILYRQLIKRAESDDKAFVNETNGKYLTYKQLLRLSCSLANALRISENDADDVAAICSENNTYYFVAVLAALFTGLTMTVINPTYTETELKHAFDLTRPKMVFCSKASHAQILNLKPKYPCIKSVILIDGDSKHLKNAVSLMALLEQTDTLHTDVYAFSPTPLDDLTRVAFIMFSSGTTGMPKGVMITHRNVNFRLMSLYNPQIWFRSTNPNIISILPFFHAFGLQLGLGDLLDHKTTRILERFDPIHYLSCLEKYRLESIIIVPTVLVFLAKHPAVDRFNLTCLKDICYGSSPASPAIVETVAQRLGVRPRQGYGLTEVTMGITAVPVGIEKRGSIGLIYPGMSACIRNPDSGKKLGPFGEGEICLKGDSVMKGYYRNPVANKESFTEDGFLKTGDVGYYDNEEYLYVVDRMKELIKYKSFQVAPAELEAVLKTHPKIMQAAVVGLPDEEAGELPLAFVVKETNANLTEEEVKSYLAGHLSRRKHLHGGVIFVNEIPVNSLGKTLRREVRNMVLKMKSKL